MYGQSGSYERTLTGYWPLRSCLLFGAQILQPRGNKIADAGPKSRESEKNGPRAGALGTLMTARTLGPKGGFVKMIRRFGYAVLTVLAIASLASAGTITFSFRDRKRVV